MKFNQHKELEGKHAFLGASNYHWLNYDDEVLEERFYSQFSQVIGTTIHQLAHDCIVSGTKLSKHDVRLIELTLYKAFVPRAAYDPNYILANLVPFINDAIGFNMQSEILLYYSPWCFGTTDAIGFDEKNKILRISDYKNGSTPASFKQPYIYAAVFCLEYNYDPRMLNRIECRIYQNMETLLDVPSGDVIYDIMCIIKHNVSLIQDCLERGR